MRAQRIIGSDFLFVFDTMWKRNVREGTESFATIGAVVLEILLTRGEGENRPPPIPGRGSRTNLTAYYRKGLKEQSNALFRGAAL